MCVHGTLLGLASPCPQPVQLLSQPLLGTAARNKLAPSLFVVNPAMLFGLSWDTLHGIPFDMGIISAQQKAKIFLHLQSSSWILHPWHMVSGWEQRRQTPVRPETEPLLVRVEVRGELRGNRDDLTPTKDNMCSKWAVLTTANIAMVDTTSALQRGGACMTTWAVSGQRGLAEK